MVAITKDFDEYNCCYYSQHLKLDARIYCWQANNRVATIDFIKKGQIIPQNSYDPTPNGLGICVYFEAERFTEVLTILQTEKPQQAWIDLDTYEGGIVTSGYGPVGENYWAKCVLIPVGCTEAGPQENYVKKLNIVRGAGSNSAGTIYLNGQALNWPFDIRFVANDRLTLLPFWRSESDDIDGTWYVQIDFIPANGSQNIYLFYGKASSEDLSNIESIAIDGLGEDFRLENTLSPKWSIIGSPDINVGMNNPDIDVAIDVTVSGVFGKYEAWPQICVDSIGTIYCIYRTDSDGLHGFSGTGKVVIRTSLDHGRTWGSEVVVSDEANVDDRNPSIACIRYNDADRLIVFYNELLDGLSPNHCRAYMRYSDDNGSTWSSKISLDSGESRAAYTKAIQLSNGNLLGGIYYNYSLYVFKSTNGGEAWTKIATVSSSTKEIAEQHLFEIKTNGVYSGRVFMICRNQTSPYKLQAFFSSDYGETWSSPADIDSIAYDNWASPPGAMVRELDDSILMPVSYQNGIMLYRSIDECQSWKRAGWLYRQSNSNIARAYVQLDKLANGKLGIVFCSNQNPPGTSDVYFADFPAIDGFDNCLEIWQKSTPNRYIESIVVAGPNVAIEAKAKWISGSVSSDCASVNWGFGYYHEAVYDTNGVRMERRTASQYYLLCCDYSGRALQSSGQSREAGYKHFLIKFMAAKCQLYQDGIKIDGDIASHIPTIALPVVIGPTSNALYIFGHYEWLFIRNCVDPEPVWDTPGVEETGGIL